MKDKNCKKIADRMQGVRWDATSDQVNSISLKKRG
jgi:hypothetical protein